MSYVLSYELQATRRVFTLLSVFLLTPSTHYMIRWWMVIAKATKTCVVWKKGGDRMEKNIELYRLILKKLEDNTNEYYYVPPGGELVIEGYENDEIVYNLKLMIEDNLIHGAHRFNGLEIVELAIKPTSTGHDFIRMAKDDSVWGSFKKKTGDKIYSMPIELLFNKLTSFISNL